MLNMDMANIVAIGQGWHCEHGWHDENGGQGAARVDNSHI